MSMQEVVDFFNGLIWSKALIYGCLVVGLYFSVRTPLCPSSPLFWHVAPDDGR